MKIFRRISIIAVFALPFVMSAYVLAQTATKNSVPIEATVSKPSDTSYGEVRKIDKEAGKLTLRHGKIENLDMPPMTMVFRVNDKSMLDKIKVGDNVKFKTGIKRWIIKNTIYKVQTDIIRNNSFFKQAGTYQKNSTSKIFFAHMRSALYLRDKIYSTNNRPCHHLRKKGYKKSKFRKAFKWFNIAPVNIESIT
jgi:Cu/Ag efflux protein CusF